MRTRTLVQYLPTCIDFRVCARTLCARSKDFNTPCKNTPCTLRLRVHFFLCMVRLHCATSRLLACAHHTMPPKATKGKGGANGVKKGAKPSAKSSISLKGKGKGGKGGAPTPKVSGNGGKGALSSMFDTLDAKRKAAGDAKAAKSAKPQKAKRVADVASKQKDKRADAVKAKREKKVFNAHAKNPKKYPIHPMLTCFYSR